MDLKTVVNAFATEAYKRRECYKVENIALYGSMARGEPNPNDADVLIIHTNTIFEAMQTLRHRDKCKNNGERLEMVEKMLIEESFPALDWIKDMEEVMKSIKGELLNAHYLHTLFFKENPFREMVVGRNENPLFYENVFREGKIWTPETGEFSIPLEEKYDFHASIIQP